MVHRVKRTIICFGIFGLFSYYYLDTNKLVERIADNYAGLSGEKNNSFENFEIIELDMAGVMEIRRQLIADTCKEHKDDFDYNYKAFLNDKKTWKLNGTEVFAKSLFVHEGIKIGWCKVPKASSTSVVQQFYEILKPRDFSIRPKADHMIIYKIMPKPRKSTLPPMVKFLIVRHPLKRLLSAYRDKFFSPERRHYIRIQGKAIKYRIDPSLKKYFGAAPTFREFVQYLINTDPRDFNIHWVPIYLYCATCLIKYDSIIHMESYNDDIEHLINITGIEKLKISHRHETQPIKVEYFKGKKIPADKIEQLHFSTLDENMLEKLGEIYAIDMKMFGYSLQPFKDYPKNLSWSDALEQIITSSTKV